MISTTLRDYKDNYQTNLDTFLREYEDNTESIFLQNELDKYYYFLDVLIKNRNFSVNFTFQTFDEYLNNLNPEFIGIDLKKPENYITSSERIIEFINSKRDNIEKKFMNVTEAKVIPEVKKLTAFNWKSNLAYQYSTILWQMLKEAKFISDSTELEQFHIAFSGTILEYSLMIKWTAKGKNNQVNKHLLFYLVNKLADNNLIDENIDNTTFIKKLGIIFCDHNGSVLSNLKVSNTTSSNRDKIKRREKTKDEKKIDVMIENLVQMTAK